MAFEESTGSDPLDAQQRALLARKINELALIIPGTRLEAFIEKLYDELENAGISLKPKTYLSDEWGCPDGVPAIGIPFYLGLPELHKLEGDLTGMDVEEGDEIMMILRHECGHAFNYAHQLYLDPLWTQVFGSFSHPYDDDYKPVPFSSRFVRHLPGWYAQKHPDEDFSETFAVWLTPGAEWRERYAGTPALAKLLCVDELARNYGRRPPAVSDATPHMPVDELTMTLDEWYGRNKDAPHPRLVIPRALDNDLLSLFPAKEGDSAAGLLRLHRKQLLREVNRWTGMAPELLAVLVDRLAERARVLDLKIDPAQSPGPAVALSSFLTALAMNYVSQGTLVEP